MATATLLPPARAVFYDANGNPLAGGLVNTYVPGGTTPKATWQDAGETTANANPIVLDAAGSCLLYGSGSYQLTVTDSLGNAIPAYSGVTGTTIATATITNIASLRALNSAITAPGTAYVTGYSTPADGGEGMFVYNPSDTTSADNGGTIIVDAAGNRWYRDTQGSALSVKWFGATGNGTAIDTAAYINTLACIVSLGGGTIYIPNGQYNLTSAFVTSGGQNAIIPLPAVAQNSKNITIRFEGESNVPAYGPPVPTGGVVLFCNTAASTSNGIVPSVIGYGAASFASIAWSCLTVEMRNLTVRVQPNGGVVPIDLYAVTNADLENVAVTVNAAPGSIPTPTVQTPGIKLPATGNFGWVKCRKFFSTGFYFGAQHSEHADIEGLINFCIAAIYIPDSYSHLAKYRITTQYCSYSIYTVAQSSTTFGYCNSLVGELDIERDPELPFVSDIYAAPGSLLNGILNYNVAASPNSGISISGGGAVHLILNNIAEPQTAQAIVGYSPTTTSTITPLATETIALPESLTGAITLTLEAGNETGQIVRVYGSYQYPVTVQPTNGTLIYLQDNESISSWTFNIGAGSSQFIELVWTGGTETPSWLAHAVGGFNIFSSQVAAATTPASFQAQKIITLYDADGGGPYYVPASSNTW